jgi:hypothetical protein
MSQRSEPACITVFKGATSTSMRRSCLHLLAQAFVVTALLAFPRSGLACVGDGCINIYSTEPGGGKLTTNYDLANRKVVAFPILPTCTTTCIYSTIDPGFINGSQPPPDGYHAVADGVAVRFETVSEDDAATFRLNNRAVAPGESELIGTTPDLHNHPSWQLRLPNGEEGEYQLQFKLTTDSPLYADSDPFTAILTNVEQATPTATPTPTVAIPVCVGDCDGDGTVTTAELVQGVGGALGHGACAEFDVDEDETISVRELIMAVNASMNTCVPFVTPTPTLPATLAAIQESFFSPRCAIPTCHDSLVRSGGLNLEPDHSYDELVGIKPTIDTAREAGFYRVDAGNPENSFLLVKLEGPPPGEGGRMPLEGALLTPAEIDVIRVWIEDGALP